MIGYCQNGPREGVIKVRKPGSLNFYLEIDTIPSYNGNLIEDIEKQIKYPHDAFVAKKSGIVLVSCIIDESGKVIWAETKRSVNKSLDAEAVRVVKLLNRFRPYMLNGKVYSVKFDIPVRFSLIR